MRWVTSRRPRLACYTGAVLETLEVPTHVRVIFEKQPFGELERLVTRRFLDVLQAVAKGALRNDYWLRMVADLSGRSFEEMRLIVVEFLDTDIFHRELQNLRVPLHFRAPQRWRGQAKGPDPVNSTRVSSGVRLSRTVRLTLALPICPLFSVNSIRSFGRKPSALLDENPPPHEGRPELPSSSVMNTWTWFKDLPLVRSTRAK